MAARRDLTASRNLRVPAERAERAKSRDPGRHIVSIPFLHWVPGLAALARDTQGFDPVRLLLVRHTGRDVIELLAAGCRHDHRATNVDPVITDAGVRLEGE